jgi:hypothetical protein
VTFLDAALTVLEANGRAMTAHEIVAAAVQQGLLTSTGKTPVATLSARLYTYVRDHPDGRLVRLAEVGSARARRGSVRWALRDSGADDRKARPMQDHPPTGLA